MKCYGKVRTDRAGTYVTLINSASAGYGGGEKRGEHFMTDEQNMISIDVPPLCGLILKREEETGVVIVP